MTNIRFINKNEPYAADLLLLLGQEACDAIDLELQGALSFNLKREAFSWESDKSVWMTTNGAYPIPKIVVAAKKADLGHLACEKRVAIGFGTMPPEKILYKLLLQRPCAEMITVICHDPAQAEKAFIPFSQLLIASEMAKKMIEAPANLMPPETFAKECLKLEAQGVKVTILDEKELKTIGAEALLAIGKGSINPPCMVILDWEGDRSSKPIVLVGKGICFDAGGIQLKTSHLTEMKWDKAGAGAVFGALDAISRIKSSVHVIGILVLAENMPDGAALKPGDIITTLGGKSVEIVDTDCEGRLALADGLSYAQKNFSPRALIDIGTLTLETFGALGHAYSGLFCNNERLMKALIQAGENVDEPLWPLPLGDYYARLMRSKIADLKNAGGFRYGASSAAAEFLRSFVDPSIPWAHIDIAGTAWDLEAPEKGVTGVGIRLFVEYLTKS